MAFARLSSILSDKCGLAQGQTVLVAVSGGPDSLALLHALTECGWPLLVGHFDHGLRPESTEDADFVRRVAEEWGHPFFMECGDVAAHAHSQKMGTEEAARELRYRFLFDLAEREGAAAVAAAHTADDQAETVLMHLLRGAGIDGLSGMPYCSLPNPWSNQIPLIRPLLDSWREEVEAYCAEQGQQPRRDASNQDPGYFRNRLRQVLLPALAEYNPQAKAHLYQSARLLAQDRLLLDQLAAKAWPRVVPEASRDYVRFERLAFLAEPEALQGRLIRRAYARLRASSRNLGLSAVEQALLLAGQPFSGQQEWLDGLYLLAEGNDFWIADVNAELPVHWPQLPTERLNLELPGALALGDWRLVAGETEEFEAAKLNRDGYQAWLDAERLGSQLLLRRRQPGDRFQPLGMQDGTLKLADFMVNAKLPQRARDAWPLLCREDEIVWVPGYQIAHPYRVQPDSRRALHVQLSSK